MNEPQEEHRKEGRIKRGYIIKFRQVDPPVISDGWSANKPIDISKSGISFYSEIRFPLGAKLQIRISNPLLHHESLYEAKVVRCNQSAKMKIFYEVAATIHAMDPEARAAFEKAIEIFLSKDQEKR